MPTILSCVLCVLLDDRSNSHVFKTSSCCQLACLRNDHVHTSNLRTEVINLCNGCHHRLEYLDGCRLKGFVQAPG